MINGIRPDCMNKWIIIGLDLSNEVTVKSAVFNIARTWKTDYGNMVISQTGTNVTGTYPSGRIEGTLNYNQAKGK